MRLLTHNYLKSNVKGTQNGYPLIIEANTIEYIESPIDRELLLKILPKINYSTLKTAVEQIMPLCKQSNIDIDELASNLEIPNEDVGTIQNLYKVLFDIHVTTGGLICPDTGRKFPIVQGIPNMVLHEDEV